MTHLEDLCSRLDDTLDKDGSRGLGIMQAI